MHFVAVGHNGLISQRDGGRSQECSKYGSFPERFELLDFANLLKIAGSVPRSHRTLPMRDDEKRVRHLPLAHHGRPAEIATVGQRVDDVRDLVFVQFGKNVEALQAL